MRVPGSRILWLGILALVVVLPLAAWQVTAHYQRSYVNVVLGSQRVDGVMESGFHYQEYAETEPFRWTNGWAKLLIPIDPKRPPQRLWVHLEAVRPKATPVRLQIVVGEVPVFDGSISPGRWEQTLDLPDQTLPDPLLIELRSDVFVPKGKMDDRKNNDTRLLGVQVKGLMLQRDDP
jgi:hypothetical protein